MVKFKHIHTISNYISFSRVLLGIPIIIFLDKLDQGFSIRLILTALCLLALLTDLLDGYFARKFNEISELGKIIDPFADKLLVAIIIVKLYLIDEIPEFYFWVIILRDILIFTGGIFISQKLNKVLPSNLLGKITVLTIGFFILTVILNFDVHAPIIYDIFYFVSLTLSFLSVGGYALRGFELIKWNKKNNEAV